MPEDGRLLCGIDSLQVLATNATRMSSVAILYYLQHEIKQEDAERSKRGSDIRKGAYWPGRTTAKKGIE